MRATAIAMVFMAAGRWASWWRGVSHPPPATWVYVFEDFTEDEKADEWALAAAIFIAQYRRRQSRGPTFRELFEHLLPDSAGIPSSLPADWDIMERRRGISGFRRHIAIDWRRRGYIGFDREVTRSLRVGPRFRERSRALQIRRAQDVDNAIQSNAAAAAAAAATESLSADEVLALLSVSPTYLQRLSDRGYLHAVNCDAMWRYPSWQFASRPGMPVVPGISVVVPAIPKHWPAATIQSFMRSPRVDLTVAGSARTPVEWLIEGHDPHRVAGILEALETPHAT